MKKRLLKALAGVLAAAIVLGAMPISTVGAAEPFTDVKTGAWYASLIIRCSSTYKLLSGVTYQWLVIA